MTGEPSSVIPTSVLDASASNTSTRAPKVPDAMSFPSGETADCHTWLNAPTMLALSTPVSALKRSTDSDHADVMISLASALNTHDR